MKNYTPHLTHDFLSKIGYFIRLGTPSEGYVENLILNEPDRISDQGCAMYLEIIHSLIIFEKKAFDFSVLRIISNPRRGFSIFYWGRDSDNSNFIKISLDREDIQEAQGYKEPIEFFYIHKNDLYKLVTS